MLYIPQVNSEVTVLTFRLPCQAEQQYLVWSHLHLSHRNHLRQVPATLSGIQTMNATGMTTTTFRRLAAILLLVFWMGCLASTLKQLLL